MPLSEEEQRLLDQLEEALAADDPSLASALRGSKLRARNRRRAAVGVLAFLLGVAVLMVGVIVTNTIVGALGFLVMLGSAYVFLNAWRSGLTLGDDEAEDEQPGVAARQPSNVSPLRRPKQRRPAQPGRSFMDRMEERWRRRREEGGER